VKNLPCVDVEVCTKFGGDWSGSFHVKEGHMYIVRYGGFQRDGTFDCHLEGRISCKRKTFVAENLSVGVNDSAANQLEMTFEVNA